MDPLFLTPPRPYSPYAPVRTRSMARPRLLDLWTQPTSDFQREAEVERIARQLARVEETVSWGRVQNDAWDRQCQFIFRVRSAEGAEERARVTARAAGVDPEDFTSYVLRRWYCFWGARLAELLFLTHPNVLAGPRRDRLVDFTIDGVPFDLKTSEVPVALGGLLADPVSNASTVATWLYRHQSRERRFHLANRIFLVLYQPNAPDQAWRLRGDVAALRSNIDGFLAHPHYVNLSLPVPDGNRLPIITAIIAVTPPILTRQLGFALEIERTQTPRPPIDAPIASDLQMILPI